MRAASVCASLVLAASSNLWHASASAHGGVSDEAVSLPDGPGSVAGAGENGSTEGNRGSFQYDLPFELPAGFPEATPSLGLHYDSMGGASEVALGWTLGVPHIERLTRRGGVPHYTRDDSFAENGSEELVRDGSTGLYSARVEGGFARYTWRADPAGRGGYFRVEYPDGSQALFGAQVLDGDVEGRPEPLASARLQAPAQDKTFRYLLSQSWDRFGHRVHYDYDLVDGYPLLSRISYLFRHGEPRFQVNLHYEARPDPLRDALPGFETRLTQRLAGVRVLVDGRLVRRYSLKYLETGAHHSLLHRVSQYGLDDQGPLPVATTFDYTPSLNLECEGCQRHVLMPMGLLSAGLHGGTVAGNRQWTLVDIDGNGLPDVLHTDPRTGHHFFTNELLAHGEQRFSAPVRSHKALGDGFSLGSPGVQVLDFDGDGLSDLISQPAGRVLCNLGDGDWHESGCNQAAIGQLAPWTDAGSEDPLRIRFFDADGDRRIDILHTPEKGRANLWRWDPSSNAFEEVEGVQGIGKSFDDESFLQLADLNGDGLLDPVEVSSDTGIWYRLNLGRGHWGAITTLPRFERDVSHVENTFWELQDLNGDGLDDVVAVVGRSVYLALNRSGSFSPLKEITSADVEGELPQRDGDTTVLFADMNASGTTDVVWVDGQGRVTVLDLFRTRPHLLRRIDNGIGQIQRIEYTSSALEQAHGPQTPLPQVLTVVKVVEDELQGFPETLQRTEFRYQGGRYDAVERRFAGFAQTESRQGPSPSQTALRIVRTFHVDDPYLLGRVASEEVYGGAEGQTSLKYTATHYGVCPLQTVSAPAQTGPMGVRFMCTQSTVIDVREGRPAAEWVRLRQRYAYDGFGNVALAVDEGVIGFGLKGDTECGTRTAPDGTWSGAAGPDCRGDEAYVRTEFIRPGDATNHAWILGRAARELRYGEADEHDRPVGAVRETLTFYDGPAFHGEPLGRLTSGNVTRVCERAHRDARGACQGKHWLATWRAAHDGHGSLRETLSPRGEPGGESHRRRTEYDRRYPMLPVAEEVYLRQDGIAYRLRRERVYHRAHLRPISATRWMLQGLDRESDPAPTRVRYDAFGRAIALAEPGDSLAAPTISYAYHLAAPQSRIVRRTRAGGRGEAALLQVTCLDGAGRTTASRTRLGSALYQVEGATTYNPRGQTSRRFQSYQGGPACELAAPEHVPFSATRYDALDRPVARTLQDALVYGSPSVAHTAYRPLAVLNWDLRAKETEEGNEEDADRVVLDGLGRRILTLRPHNGQSGRGPQRALWHPLGWLAGYQDAAGHIRRQQHDLAGRLVRIEDPNAGVTTLQSDAGGNLVFRTDAGGHTVAFEYDGLDRLTAHFDPERRAQTEVRQRYDFLPDGSGAQGEGRRVLATYPVGRDTYRYDLRGQLTSQRRTVDGQTFETHSEFDNAGRLVRRRYPDATVVQRHYDPASRLRAISGVVDNIAYHPDGVPSRIAFHNGVTEYHEHDLRGRPTRLRTLDADQHILLALDYEWSRASELTSIQDERPGRVPESDRSVRYLHDDWHRTLETRYLASGETLTLAFDAIDNVTHKLSSAPTTSTAHTGELKYSAERPNAALRAGPQRMAYDATGQLSERHTTRLFWDHAGRWTGAEPRDGHPLHIDHGVGSERVRETRGPHVTWQLGPDFLIRDGISSIQVRWNGRHLARIQSSALATRLYGEWNDETSPNVGDAVRARKSGQAPALLAVAARRMLLQAEGNPITLHGDALRHVTLATDAHGKTRGRRHFYPSGSVRFARGYVSEFGFTGQRSDPTTGLVLFRHRELDPRSMRWTKPDPLFSRVRADQLGAHGEVSSAYAYVAGGVASLVDPTGLGLSATSGPRARGRVAQRAHRLARRRARAFRRGGRENLLGQYRREMQRLERRVRREIQGNHLFLRETTREIAELANSGDAILLSLVEAQVSLLDDELQRSMRHQQGRLELAQEHYTDVLHDPQNRAQTSAALASHSRAMDALRAQERPIRTLTQVVEQLLSASMATEAISDSEASRPLQ